MSIIPPSQLKHGGGELKNRIINPMSFVVTWILFWAIWVGLIFASLYLIVAGSKS